jgi:hypothetical protein
VISNADMEGLIKASGGTPKLAAVQDVTCDLKASFVSPKSATLADI